MKIDTFSILIPTHNRSDLLEKTLESIGQVELQPGVDIEVIVVANACSDDTVAVSRRCFTEYSIPGRVVEEATPGLNVARTRAVSESRGEVCALLDDDVWLDSSWINGMLLAFRKHHADVVAGKVELWWEEIEKPDWFPSIASSLLSANALGDEMKVLDQPWGVIGANFAFRRDMFDRVGGFRPGLDRVGDQLLSGGESEFVLRVLASGGKVVYSPTAQAKHWVPEKRLSKEYLTGVSFGNAVARVLMRPHFSAFRYLRSFVGHTLIYLRHAVALPLAKCKGHRGEILTHQCLMAVGRGGLSGLWQRASRKRKQ